MSPASIYMLTAVALLSIGLVSLVRQEHLLRRLLALNIVTSAIFLFLVALAYGDGSTRPDPVPHAMVLTGIVVAVSATAFALALIRRLYAQTGRAELVEDVDPEDESE